MYSTEKKFKSYLLFEYVFNNVVLFSAHSQKERRIRRKKFLIWTKLGTVFRKKLMGVICWPSLQSLLFGVIFIKKKLLFFSLRKWRICITTKKEGELSTWSNIVDPLFLFYIGLSQKTITRYCPFTDAAITG